MLLNAEASTTAIGLPGSYVDVDMSEAHNSTDWALSAIVLSRVCATQHKGLGQA